MIADVDVDGAEPAEGSVDGMLGWANHISKAGGKSCRSSRDRL